MTSSAPLFDQLAANYEEHFAASHRRAYDALAWEVVARHLPETAGLVVDVGCGIGRWVERFLALGHRERAARPQPGNREVKLWYSCFFRADLSHSLRARNKYR